IYNKNIRGHSKLETLSPIFNTIGMSYTNAIGVNTNKINIITEGITDTMLLSALTDVFKEEKYVFIPAIGAANMLNIAIILQSWGREYICIFDGDAEGKRQKLKMENKYNLESVMTLSDVNIDIVEIEDLIDDEDYNQLNLSRAGFKESKSKRLYAQKIVDAWLKEPDKVSKKTRENFQSLLNIIKELSTEY